MEGDTIRASGSNTLVDLWLIDRVQPICITGEAIAANVGFARAATMNEEERCRFVRANLALVLEAATAVIRETGGTSKTGGSIVVDGSALVNGSAPGEDRRKGDRRKTGRRTAARPASGPTTGDRRRNERRVAERRRPGRPKTSS